MSDKIAADKGVVKGFYSSINFRLSLINAGAFAVLSVVVLSMVFSFARNEALRQAEEKTMIILNRNLASHKYINTEVKPRLFSFTKSIITPDYFDPYWMSSTFAIRELNRINNVLSGKDSYYYKECAINARSPLNEADDFERLFLLDLNKDPKLAVKSGVRNIAGKPYFYVLRRGETMEDDCLRCHSRPSKAPGGLVAYYGPERSFDRKVSDVVSALSIRIPLEQAYAEANRLALRLSLVVISSFAFLFLFMHMLMQRYIFVPLSIMRQKTENIISNDKNLGTEMPVSYGSELNELAISFNTMSHKLKDQMDKLEDRVKERTIELELANKELEQKIHEIRTLRGILPICAYCKKIRDDKGYWEQLEGYITKHSEALFSHGMCPECAQKALKDTKAFMKRKKPDSQ